MIRFIPTDPDDLPIEALTWLSASIRKTPGNLSSLADILDHSRSSKGSFFLVKSDKLIGCIYFEWLPQALNIVSVGGDNIKDWRNEMHDFCVGLIRERGIKTIMFMGRHGLGKIFPQFKFIGTVFRYEDK